ncbi:MAG: MFS transporter [Acidobacteria bacterium]|nr:MFS transporter [Acidobacteriota bacterium]
MRSLLPDLGPLRDSREFRLLYAGQFVSNFGSAISYVVLPLQMYQLTKSPLMVGLLGLVEFFPMVLLAFVSGAVADRWDRRRLIVMVEAGQTLCCLALVANAFQPQPAVWPLWLVAGLLAGLGAFHRPAMEAMTPQLLTPEQMTGAASWNSLRHNFAHIAGPGLAGVIASTLGAGTAFLLDGASFVFSMVMLLRMRPLGRPVGANEENLTWHTLLEGWRYARKRQDLLGTYLIDMNAMFFGMPNALFPALAEQWGAHTVGWLYAAPSVGALLASLTSGWAGKVQRHGVAITLAAAGWGLAIVGFGAAGPLWLALLFLALAGACDMISGLFRMTMWNQTIPQRLRGRTAAIEMVSYLSGPYLGNAEAGVAARAFGLRSSVMAGGAACVVGCAVLAALLPKFIAYRSTEGVQRREAEEGGLQTRQ